MFSFNSISAKRTDTIGGVIVRVILTDDVNGQDECFFLEYRTTPLQATVQRDVVGLVQNVNASRYPPAKPVWDGQLSAAVKTFLQNHGVYTIRINDAVSVDIP